MAEENEHDRPGEIWGFMGHPKEIMGGWKEERLYPAGAQVDKNKLMVDNQL